jgi:guanylate kinase
LLFVLSGPSGVGKDAALKRLKELGLVDIHFIVTATTRPPRPHEVDGRDYWFVSEDEFKAMIERDELLEWALVYGAFKGVPKREVREAIAQGKDVIMRIDVQGAATIRQKVPQAVFIFMRPGSLAELEQRLRARHTESPEELQRRLSIAPAEMTHVDQFDYVVTNRNDALDDAVRQIAAIIIAERCRVHPREIII